MKSDWYNKWLWQKSMAWVHKGKKIAYLNIGKNASSSMKQILEPIGFRRTQEYYDNSGYFTFAIVREPIDRFASGFISVLANETSRKESGDKYHDFIFQHNYIGTLLVDFVTQIEVFGFFDDHILPQKYTISNEHGALYRVDIFILYEKLREDFDKIRQIVKEDIELKHINRIDEYRHFPFKRTQPLSAYKEQIINNIMEDWTGCDVRSRLRQLYIEDFILYEWLKRNQE